MYPEYLSAPVQVGKAYVDYAVESAGAKQSVVQYVGAVRGRYDLDIAQGRESVQFRQELHEGPLDLTVSGSGYVKPLGTDRIQLVYEYYAGRLLFGKLEQLADQSGTLSDVLLDEFGPDKPYEGCLGRIGDSLGHKGLPRSRGTHQQNALGRFYADLGVELGSEKRILHRFPELKHLLLEAAYVIVGDVRLIQYLGPCDYGVQRRRQHAHHGQCLLVERYPRSGDQILRGAVL